MINDFLSFISFFKVLKGLRIKSAKSKAEEFKIDSN